MRETQKVKRHRRVFTSLRSSFGRKATELDQPRFLGMQFQVKLGKPVLECSEAAYRIDLLTESEDEIVRVAYDDDFSVCIAFPPCHQPEIQNIMQEHVREER